MAHLVLVCRRCNYGCYRFICLLLNDFRSPRVVRLPTDVLVCRHSAPLQHYMKVGQMTQEEQGAEVEEAGDADDDLELDEQG